jgi:hypothetical protein
MVGKTIARVEEPPYEDYGESYTTIIWFTDGTAVKMHDTGYETDGIEITPTTAAELDAQFVEQIEYQIEREWERHQAALRKHHECLVMAEASGGADTRAFKQWYQNRYGMTGFARVLKDEYSAALADFMRQANRQTLFFKGDHVE